MIGFGLLWVVSLRLRGLSLLHCLFVCLVGCGFDCGVWVWWVGVWFVILVVVYLCCLVKGWFGCLFVLIVLYGVISLLLYVVGLGWVGLFGGFGLVVFFWVICGLGWFCLLFWLCFEFVGCIGCGCFFGWVVGVGCVWVWVLFWLFVWICVDLGC